MISLNVHAEVAAAARMLSDLQRKQIAFAARRAVTDTAQHVAKAMTADLPHIFDRPTPFTERAIGVQAATKDRPFARVFVRDTQAKYLLPQEVGGDRTPAGNTRKPDAKALVLPGVLKLNQYGNIPSGKLKALNAQIAKALARKQGVARRSGRKPGGIFYVRGDTPQAHGKRGGFWRRLPNGKLQLIAEMADRQTVKPRFGFGERAISHGRAKFAQSLADRLKEALANAR